MKTVIISLKYSLVTIILLGIIFPLVVWAGSQIAFPYQANGSKIVLNGKVVGSELIGQKFEQDKYFHGRPSAAGSGYDSSNSSGTNLGPTSDKLINGVNTDTSKFTGIISLESDYRKTNLLDDNLLLPADAVTYSASGLDPHISIQNAKLQANRISKSRNIEITKIINLIDSMTEARYLGIFGEPRVNVLKINIALDEIKK